MTYDIYRYIFIGAAILCGIMFIASVFVFIFLKIPKVISDLSGATARKAIKNIREQNEATGNKAHKVSSFNQARGKLTDKITPSGSVIQRSKEQMCGISTTKISTQQLSDNITGTETTVLSAENFSEETSVLSQQGSVNETAVLSKERFADETTPLAEKSSSDFCIEYEITFIHTDEIIVSEAVS